MPVFHSHWPLQWFSKLNEHFALTQHSMVASVLSLQRKLYKIFAYLEVKQKKKQLRVRLLRCM